MFSIFYEFFSAMLVNCSVLCWSSNRLIYPWKILPLEQSGTTVSQFYEDAVLKDMKNMKPDNFDWEVQGFNGCHCSLCPFRYGNPVLWTGTMLMKFP